MGEQRYSVAVDADASHPAVDEDVDAVGCAAEVRGNVGVAPYLVVAAHVHPAQAAVHLDAGRGLPGDAQRDVANAAVDARPVVAAGRQSNIGIPHPGVNLEGAELHPRQVEAGVTDSRVEVEVNRKPVGEPQVPVARLRSEERRVGKGGRAASELSIYIEDN